MAWLAGVESILCMYQERMHHGFTNLAVVVAQKILTQEAAQFLLLLYHKFSRRKQHSSCCCCTINSLTQQAAAVVFFVVVSYCLVVMSKICMYAHMRGGCTVDLPSSFATNSHTASSRSWLSCCCIILIDC